MDALFEQAVLVADTVTVGRNFQRRHAVHETGGQPAEAAIAESCVGLDQQELFEIDAEACQRAFDRIDQTQIGQRVQQQPADQKFDGQIIDAFFVQAFGLAPARAPDVDDAVAHRQRRRAIPVVRHGGLGLLADDVSQLRDDGVSQCRFVGIRLNHGN